MVFIDKERIANHLKEVDGKTVATGRVIGESGNKKELVVGFGDDYFSVKISKQALFDSLNVKGTKIVVDAEGNLIEQAPLPEEKTKVAKTPRSGSVNRPSFTL